MSHMRSYSTLLCHILNSNPDIDGYVEMHKPYSKQIELLELTLRVRHTTGSRLRGRYVVDKVLHNYDMAPQILRRSDVYAIYSVRDPEHAIRSILAMGYRRKKPDWKSDPVKVVNHYIRRLNRMAEQSRYTKRRSLYFDAQAIVDNTDAVLVSLTKFLELKEPLSPQYRTAELTGTWKYGDASKFITKGEIVSQRSDYSDVEVPPELLKKAREEYDRCRAELIANCKFSVETASSGAEPGSAASG